MFYNNRKVLAKLIKLNYEQAVPKTIKKIATKLKEHGFECYLVGGAIRDYCLGKTPHEFDLATNAHPENVVSIFKYTVPTGIKHGTILVLLDGMQVEVTTFRADGEYLDGRRPESVSYSDTIEEDVSRRDFTINAMALNLTDYSFVDLFGGINDLENKVIKTVGEATQRFREDGLRIMRAIRFASRFNFEIENQTYEAMKSCVDMLNHISNERIHDEFNGILLSDNPFFGVEMLRKIGALELIIPELLKGYGVEQNKYHKYDIYYHNLHSLKAVEKYIDSEGNYDEEMTLIIKLAALFHDIAKPVVKKQVEKKEADVYYNHEVVGAAIAKKIMRRLKYSNDEINFVALLIRHHMFYYEEDWTDGAVRRFMRSVGLENVAPLLKLREADRMGSGKKQNRTNSAMARLLERIDKIIDEENAITVKDLKINGDILIAEFGLKQGRMIGDVLNYLLEMILDEPGLNEYEILFEKAKEYIDKQNT